MDRKKTILIAVLINAGLLAVLFVAAITTQEESVPQSMLVEHSLEKEPLFNGPLDLVETPLKAPDLEVLEPRAPIALAQVEEKKEEPPLHKLPPLVKESKPLAVAAPKKMKEVVVKKGDTLERIARANHTTVDAIIQMNSLPSSFLRIGQVLKVPTEKTFASAPKLKQTPNERTGGPEYYTVKVGDNPWTIAMKHHMKVAELLRLNGLNEDKARKLKPGDRLRIR